MDVLRKSRVGFVVVKLLADGATYYLMRFNSKWKDVNFIGGHEKSRDAGDLRKTAQRELWEEVPLTRSYEKLEFETLTNLLTYGPVYSRSRGDRALYEVQFFLVKFLEPPNRLIEMLTARSKNVWVTEADFAETKNYKMSGLAQFLGTALDGGLQGVPLSYPDDLSSLKECFHRGDRHQRTFAFK